LMDRMMMDTQLEGSLRSSCFLLFFSVSINEANSYA
jgi:hypothetical protein